MNAMARTEHIIRGELLQHALTAAIAVSRLVAKSYNKVTKLDSRRKDVRQSGNS